MFVKLTHLPSNRVYFVNEDKIIWVTADVNGRGSAVKISEAAGVWIVKESPESILNVGPDYPPEPYEDWPVPAVDVLV